MKFKLLLTLVAFALCANLRADGFQIGAVQSNVPAHKWQLAGEQRWHAPRERISVLAKNYTIIFQPPLASRKIVVTAGHVTIVQ